MTGLKIVDMRWLDEGKKDPHPRYVDLPREDLGGAHLFSDDELANKLSMMSTISDERDTSMMINSHRTSGDYVCKSMLGEIAKDRLRWLSRRVAVLEGRYPGKPGYIAPTEPLVSDIPPDDDGWFNEITARVRVEEHISRIKSILALDKCNSDVAIRMALAEQKIQVNPDKVITVLGCFPFINYVTRWHVLVTLVRSLLKEGIYIPLNHEKYYISEDGRALTIQKSKYHNTGHMYVINRTPHPVDFIEVKAEEIYNSWKDVKGWTPWQQYGNSTKHAEARQQARAELAEIKFVKEL